MSRAEKIDNHRERRQEFINQHKHEIGGMILDAALEGRKGAELALFSRSIMQRVDARLAMIFDQLIPPPQIVEEPKQQLRVAK